MAAALAACWPVTPLSVPVLVEADASGGDMAVWHRRRVERGLGSLAAASRRSNPQAEQGDNPLLDHAEQVAGCVPTVMAETAAPTCASAIYELAHHPALLRSGGVAVVDVGRISPRTAGSYLLWHADAVVVSVREDPAQLGRLAACAPGLARLEEAGIRVGACVVDRARCFSDREIAEQTQMPVWARMPHDPLGAAFVRGEALPAGRGWWARARGWLRERRDITPVEWLPLMQAARGLAERLEELGERTPAWEPTSEQRVGAPVDEESAAPAPQEPVALMPTAPCPVTEQGRAA
ncbi:hypothetical protein GCM10023405_19080 [Streptomonospora salina]